MTAPNPPEEHGPQRIFTLRAILIGLALVVVLGIVTPWNDGYVLNVRMFSHAMPPIVTLVLLLIALAVNPLLGKRRLRAGELMVITTMMLSLGGVVSSGLMRTWPASVAAPARGLATEVNTAMQAPLTPLEHMEIADAAFGEIFQLIAALDTDNDRRIQATEWRGERQRFEAIDSDGDGVATAEELAARHETLRALAQSPWRWVFPNGLFFSIPPAGPIDPNDPEYKFLVGGFMDGLQTARTLNPRVDYRSRVAWRDQAGELHEQIAYSGTSLDRRIEPDWLDLDYGLGAKMRGKSAGSSIDTPSGRVAIERVGPPRPPWLEWLRMLGHWSPLLIGGFLAVIGMSFMVRKQWMDHERLPFPIANVTAQLIAEPSGRSRFSAIFHARAFWIGFGVVSFIMIWKELFLCGYLPVDIATSFDLRSAFSGSPWDQVHSPNMIFTPRIYFSMVALTFFLPLDLSFSMWFFFVASNFIVMQLRISGIPIEYHSLRDANMGGYAVMVPLILWLGRRHYWALLKAAFVGHRDPDLKQTVPFVWALIVGMALMLGFLVHIGAPFGASLLAVVMLMSILLILARVVAEAGVPYVVVADNHSNVLFGLTGFHLPLSAYVPLALIGWSILSDEGREVNSPYAVNTAYLGEQVQARRLPLGLIMFTTTCLGVLIAGAATVYFAYAYDGPGDAWGSGTSQEIIKKIGWGVGDSTNPETVASAAAQHSSVINGYIFGAVLTAILGLGRMMFSWWPLHPLIYINCHSYPTFAGWFSFFLGWLAKVLVMRYGGSGLYVRLKPLAVGLIAGEAVTGTVYSIFRLIARLNGSDLPFFYCWPF